MTLVLKVGGSCLGTRKDVQNSLPRIYEHLIKIKKEGKNPVLVLSAFAGESRELLNASKALSFSERLTDTVLAQGELFSTKLVQMYLQTKGLETQLFSENDLPIIASEDYGEASIQKTETSLIKKCIKKDIIPIIPGFIARTASGHLATLGFDGSDTSAIAIGAALNAPIYLYKDVSSMCTANPKRVKNTKPIEEISYTNMHLFANAGTELIHKKGVQIAQDAGIDIRVLPFIQKAGEESKGTRICRAPKNQHVEQKVIGLSYHFERGSAYITAIGPYASKGIEHIMMQCSEKKIPLNMVQMEPHFVKFKLDNGDLLSEALSQLHTAYGLDKTSNEAEIKPFTKKEPLHADTAFTQTEYKVVS